MNKVKAQQRSTLRRKRINQVPGYPEYSKSEDIYVKFKPERDINPEDISWKRKILEPVKPHYNDLWDNQSGNDLDIPGSEMDDIQEIAGSEDEENNYYSLGEEHPDEMEDLL